MADIGFACIGSIWLGFASAHRSGALYDLVWSVGALYCLMRLCVVFRGFIFETSCCVALCSMDFRNPLGSPV